MEKPRHFRLNLYGYLNIYLFVSPMNFKSKKLSVLQKTFMNSEKVSYIIFKGRKEKVWVRHYFSGERKECILFLWGSRLLTTMPKGRYFKEKKNYFQIIWLPLNSTSWHSYLLSKTFVLFFSKMAKGSTFLAHNQIGQCETTISFKNCEAVFRFARRINQW